MNTENTKTFSYLGEALVSFSQSVTNFELLEGGFISTLDEDVTAEVLERYAESELEVLCAGNLEIRHADRCCIDSFVGETS